MPPTTYYFLWHFLCLGHWFYRPISYFSYILQEVIHSLSRSKRKNGDVIFKIDMEKVDGRVEWTYLQKVLIDNWFPDNVARLIMTLVSSASVSILWNGSRFPAFFPKRGLRQGDYLFPYLSVLCMKDWGPRLVKLLWMVIGLLFLCLEVGLEVLGR